MSVESAVLIVIALIGVASGGVYSYFKLRADTRNAVADSADRTINIISHERDELGRQLGMRDATIEAMKTAHTAEISALKHQVETLTALVTKAADVDRLANLMTEQHREILNTLTTIAEAVNPDEAPGR